MSRVSSLHGRAYFLRVLRHHEDQLKVVHSQCDVIQLIDIGKEDDVLDSVFDDLWVALCTSMSLNRDR